MQLTRKTALAAASMSVVTLVSATFAVAGIMDLPVFGFGGGDAVITTDTVLADDDDVRSTSTTGTTAPKIVEQVVYEDVYERAPRPAPAPSPAAADGPGAPTSSPSPPTSPTTPSSTASTTTRRVTTTGSVTTRAPTTTRPVPPAGCDEPEWDREHQRWHCKGD